MGIDTGADKKYRITENKEVVFEGFYDDIEGIHFKYPNGEFVELAETLKELTKNDIDLRKYLIWDEILDYDNPDYTHIIKQLKEFTFEAALAEGTKARSYIEDNYELVKKHYTYRFDPLEVLNYLIGVWEKGYYVNYSH